MARIATSIEESKRLLELGIDPKSADMYWMHVKPEGYNDWWELEIIQGAFKLRSMNIPAWSLGALLEVVWKVGSKATIMSFHYTPQVDFIADLVDFIERLVNGCFKDVNEE